MLRRVRVKSRLFVLQGLLVARCSLVQARTVIERWTCWSQSRGATTRIDCNCHAALPRCAASETEACKIIANRRIARDCTVAGIESGHSVTFVYWLWTIIREDAKLFVCLVHVTNLFCLATILQQRFKEGTITTGSVRLQSTHASFCLVNTSVILNVASTPFVCDGVALSKAFVHIKTVRHIRLLHFFAPQFILAGTLISDNLIIQCHSLAIIIIQLFPVR